MPEDFDPYLQWLGIPPHERPADHYRLIGVRRFEDDIPTIEQAADQRMVEIRQRQTGPRAAHTQLILNELSTARLCLVNPAAKSAYDDMLRGFEAAETASEQAPLRTAPTARVNQAQRPAIQVEPRQKPYRKRTPFYARPAFPLVALSATAGIAATVWYVGQQFGYRPQPPAAQAPPAATSTAVGTPSTSGPMVEQETDGSVIFLPAEAELAGNELHLEAIDGEDILTGWNAEDDIATWQFRLTRLPAQGRFRVKVTYSTAGQKFVYRLAINANTKRCETRQVAGFVTDEHFFAITRTGTHTLKLRGPHARELQIKSVVLADPRQDRAGF